jgi:hypothetical protein
MSNVTTRLRERAARRRLRKEQVKLWLKNLGLVQFFKSQAFDKNVQRVDEAKRWFDSVQCMEDIYGTFEQDRRYIYFPLHLQPEMSTDALGGIYADQLRALEELCSKLAPDMIVYVKENPKQGLYMREPSFFTRLAAIPNAVYLPVSVPTFELIAQAEAVATITGTAGWEAMLMGRPAIAFGQAWWAGLPGAFRWQEIDDLDAIFSHEHDRNALEGAFHALTARMGTGVIDPKYGRLLEKYDPRRSAEEVAQSLAVIGLST